MPFFVPNFKTNFMKYLVVILLTVFLTNNSFSQEGSESGAFLSIKSDTLNFGTLNKTEDATRKIEITNTGNKPLIINDCKGSCGCTVPQCPEQTILPGESDFISISYDNKSNSGPFKKTVTIKSNAINRVVYIKVQGEVIE